MSVIDAVRDFLGSELRIAQAAELDPELPLVQRGVIDSIELMQIVLFLERRYGISVDETEILPANLRSLSAIERFVASKQGSAPGAGT
ncbi:MAG: phosphopantetheine-binding protein [Thermoanaerobaculales bacterium]|jgi:acyl carrier protein|nr:phosphopantetheine-binding protein [Thermoanaerobaculales bacterium]